MGIRLENSIKREFMVHHKSESYVVVEVKSKQHLDPLLVEFNESDFRKFNEAFYQRVRCT